MSHHVTEEMISAYLDGELSPEDRTAVERALSTDESLRLLLEGFRESRSALQASSDFVSSSIALPPDFSSRVMTEIRLAEAAAGEDGPQTSNLTRSSEAASVLPGRKNSFSLRTLLEVVAATAALVVIVFLWKSGESPAEVAQPENRDPVASKGGVSMMNLNKSEKGSGTASRNSSSNPAPKPTSREFSVFVDAGARPQIDRFWILENYEITAPDGTDPGVSAKDRAAAGGDAGKIEVLLVDAKKGDAIKFFSRVPKWDSQFQVFQEAKTGDASWLAPFDVSDAAEAEGDFWTLKIVLISK